MAFGTALRFGYTMLPDPVCRSGGHAGLGESERLLFNDLAGRALCKTYEFRGELRQSLCTSTENMTILMTFNKYHAQYNHTPFRLGVRSAKIISNRFA